MQRRGRIDEIDIQQLDVDGMFADKSGKFDHTNYAKSGFERPPAYYRRWVNDYKYSGYDRVIDLGGAWGRWGVFLAEVNNHVTVVDILPYLVDMGPRIAEHLGLHNMEFIVGSVEDVPVPDASYDAAWMHGLMFLTDRDRSLAEIARVLKPRGRAFMGAFNSVGKMFQKMCLGYSRGGWDNLLCKQGMQGLKHGPLAGGPPNYATTDVLDEVLAPFGLEVEREYPIKDFKGTKPVRAEDLALFKDTKALAERFARDEAFRNDMIARHNDIMLGVEFDLWFSLRKTG